MSDGERPKRAQSQTDRDLQGLEAKKAREAESAFGVPVLDLDGDLADLTPVRPIIESLQTPEMQRAVAAVWQHAANTMLRVNKRLEATEAGRLRAEIDELKSEHEESRAQLVELRGIDGKNGKVGTTRAIVDAMTARLWWGFTAAVGGIGFLLVKLVIVTRAFDAVEAQSANNAARIQLLEQVLFLKSQPAPKPDKESP